MRRALPWPFPGNRFPDELGAVVQHTVLDGSMPALVVGHETDGGWYVGNGVNDPNLPGAAVATHMRHAIERNTSIGGLASLPPGHEARRRWPGDPWVTEAVEDDP